MKNTTQQSLLKVAAVVVGLCFALLAPAQIDRAEYFWDDDPGYGQATSLTITAGGSVSIDTPLPTPATPGIHLLGLRYHGSKGWSPTITQQVTVHRAETVSIMRAEFFWDDDPGFGHGTTLLITPGSSVTVETLVALSGSPAAGNHLLGLRYKGTNGWSPTVTQQVNVPIAQQTSIVSAEYFWDDDPGFGHATNLSITPGTSVDINRLLALGDDLNPGQHLLGLRYKGTNGWSPTTVYQVYKPLSENSTILAAEYFWNEDPGFGKGTPINITPGAEVTLEDFGVPSFDVHGDATLFIRYRGTNGWSPTVAQLVMVDAEGTYTLNANAATSMEQRNYQTVGDAISDFADRGVGDNITLQIPTTGTTYELDATDGDVLTQMNLVAESIERIASSEVSKTITFAATEGTNNTVSISAASLADVLPLLAHVRTENVALQVNGTAYCFNEVTQRQQTVCSNIATEPVDLSTIGGGITATFTAQPDANTVLSGFPAEATATLPAMTIVNSGTATEALPYTVSLKQNGQTVYSYTYYIYTRASMANQAFTSMTPANGSSLDPGTVTLSWNALQEAEGYRLTVTDITNAAEPAVVLDAISVEPSQNSSHYSRQVTAEPGHRYQWQVTAVGACDELVSPLMTFEGRLLPDLTVTAITLPEAAQAGNTLTVAATIANQSEGATIEQQWTDRLYYTIGSTDFAQAVQVAELQHSGNLQAGQSYEVTFTMKVPAVESGLLRVFVETDVTAKVMESNDANNRQMSANAATLSPFYMNTADLAALRQLYSDFGGQEWSGTPWNTASELISDGNWSGVTFNTDGRVTAINLQGRGLTGSLTVVPYVATMSQLSSLNLSRNALTGDPAAFFSGATAKLTTVDLSYNQIDQLSAPLPATIATLSLGYQHRRYGANATYPGIDALATQAIEIGNGMSVTIPSIYTYDHRKQDFSQRPNLNVWNTGMSTRYGRLTWSATNECYAYTVNGWKQTATQDEAVMLVCVDGMTLTNSVLPVTMHFTRGDANLTGFVDVVDVQRTLNYVINSNNSTAFGLWAANTWTDGDASADLINIQDIVSTVNIVLSNQGDATAASRSHSPASPEGSEVPEGSAAPETPAAPAALFYADGRYIMLDTEDEVAAFCLELRGVHSDQVRLLLNRNDWQMQTMDTSDGVRLVVFSPTGQTLTTGTTQLLRLSANGAWPMAAEAASAEALPIPARVGTDATVGIKDIDGRYGSEAESIYDLQGRRHDADSHLRKGIYIKNGKKLKK